MYTRCPHCQTYFKISAEHLKKAGGKVRCGQCMKVFNSLGNLLETLPVSMAERSRPASAPPRPAASPPPAAPAPPTAPKVAKPAPAPTAAPPKPALRPEPTPAPKVAPARETSRPAAAAETPRAPEPAIVEVPERDDGATLHLDDAPSPTEATISIEETLDLTKENEIRNLDVGPTSSVRDLIPYPGDSAGAEGSLFGNAFWGAGSVVLLVVFILQYTYFMRDDLARYPELRPWLQSYCDLLGCDLPMQQNVDLIKLTHRDIIVHPRVKGALLINAVFVNNAQFVQPFPLMQIALSDTSGRVIAKRRFQPSEYLDANINLRRGMPPSEPIQIVLEIADPGKDAVNFEFNFFYQNS